MRNTTRGRKTLVATGTNDTPLREKCPNRQTVFVFGKRIVFLWGSQVIVPLSFTSPSLLYHLGGLIALGGELVTH